MIDLANDDAGNLCYNGQSYIDELLLTSLDDDPDELGAQNVSRFAPGFAVMPGRNACPT